MQTAKAEVTICRVFFENFSGDQVGPSINIHIHCVARFPTCTVHSAATPVHKHPHASRHDPVPQRQVRFLARSFGVPGDHTGQVSNGYRFPYGQTVPIRTCVCM